MGNCRLQIADCGFSARTPEAELFQTAKLNVSRRIRNLFSEGELTAAAVVKEFLITAADGKNYRTKFYNVGVIIPSDCLY